MNRSVNDSSRVSKCADSPVGRRQFLCWSAALGAGLLAGNTLKAGIEGAAPLPRDLDRLLEEIERRACRYFYEEADPGTGLVRDRARVDGADKGRLASIAATGFGLSAMAVAARRGYLEYDTARLRVERTLKFLLKTRYRKRGFYYHYVDMRTGERAWSSEISSVDTAWLLCGVLHAGAHFNTPKIRRMTSELLDAADWRWMLNGDCALCHGWTPERGFLPYRWDSYSEMLAMYLLAAGSRTSAIPASCWDSLKRPQRTQYGLTYIDSIGPLFIHQYSHAWFDFRGRRDRHADYFENSRLATLANRHLCIDLAPKFPWYGPELWGVTSSDSKHGYEVWPTDICPPDGTLAPCAAGGSVVFLPQECGRVLETMLDRFGNRVWGKYGFVDAFHPGENWFSHDVIGIDQGIMLLMAENARTEGVWRTVMATPEAKLGLAAVGFGACDSSVDRG